jgi:hypothetical protein
MGKDKTASRAERVVEFLRRLAAAPSATSEPEGYRQICEILNSVEDEMTNIPYDPANWQNDGRLYPPQVDNMAVIPGPPEVKKYRTRRHIILIGEQGAIEIRRRPDNELLVSKPGGDGKGLS